MRLSELKAQVDWALNTCGDIEIFGVPFHSNFRAYRINDEDDPVFRLALQKDGLVDHNSDEGISYYSLSITSYKALIEEHPDRLSDIVALLGGQSY
jgi:hypothetical protein